ARRARGSPPSPFAGGGRLLNQTVAACYGEDGRPRRRHRLRVGLQKGPATSNPFSPKPPLFSTLLYSLVPIIGLAGVVLFSFWMWRHHKLAYPAALVPTHEIDPEGFKKKAWR
ncbi:hypothetical protein CRENBAI_022767, partial [Crenichthys baileyi]